MKRYLLITSFLILIPYISVHGQETDSLYKHSRSISFLDIRTTGLVVQAGINFEKQINNHNKTALLFNYGIGLTAIYIPPIFNSSLTLTALFGSKPYNKRAKHFEINAGLMALIDPIFLKTWIPYPRFILGYRYQNPQSGKIFRIYSNIVSIEDGLFFGMNSLGVSFNL